MYPESTDRKELLGQIQGSVHKQCLFPYHMQMTVGNTKCNANTALQLKYTISRLLEVFSHLALAVLTLMHSGSSQAPAIYWEERYFSFTQ